MFPLYLFLTKLLSFLDCTKKGTERREDDWLIKKIEKSVEQLLNLENLAPLRWEKMKNTGTDVTTVVVKQIDLNRSQYSTDW